MRNVNHRWHVIIAYDYETIGGGTEIEATVLHAENAQS